MRFQKAFVWVCVCIHYARAEVAVGSVEGCKVSEWPEAGITKDKCPPSKDPFRVPVVSTNPKVRLQICSSWPPIRAGLGHLPEFVLGKSFLLPRRVAAAEILPGRVGHPLRRRWHRLGGPL